MDTVTWPDPYVTQPLASVRDASPLTFGLTNYISAPLAANVLLAVGASPAIGGMPDGAPHFASIASGVWINVASLITDPADLLLETARAAGAAGTPWVLDPVTVGAGVPANDALAQDLLLAAPAAVRGNASEVIALAGGASTSKGVDSTSTTAEALEHARDLARRTGAVVATSGETDLVTDGDRVVAVPGGHPWLTQVTATGCSLGALTAALIGANPDDALRATVSAHAALAVSAERAAARSRGTGSFAAALLDELSLLHEDPHR